MKNKKLFAILTLVCFMMTLMPVAAFAAVTGVTVDSYAANGDMKLAVAGWTNEKVVIVADADATAATVDLSGSKKLATAAVANGVATVLKANVLAANTVIVVADGDEDDNAATIIEKFDITAAEVTASAKALTDAAITTAKTAVVGLDPTVLADATAIEATYQLVGDAAARVVLFASAEFKAALVTLAAPTVNANAALDPTVLADATALKNAYDNASVVANVKAYLKSTSEYLTAVNTIEMNNVSGGTAYAAKSSFATVEPGLELEVKEAGRATVIVKDATGAPVVGPVFVWAETANGEASAAFIPTGAAVVGTDARGAYQINVPAETGVAEINIAFTTADTYTLKATLDAAPTTLKEAVKINLPAAYNTVKVVNPVVDSKLYTMTVVTPFVEAVTNENTTSGTFTVAANGVEATKVTVAFTLGTNVLPGLPVAIETNSSSIEVSDANLTTNYKGEVTFYVSGTVEGIYAIDITCLDFEASIPVSVGSVAASDIELETEAKAPIALNTGAANFNLAQYVQVAITDVNGNGVTSDAAAMGVSNAANAATKYVSFVEKPAASKLTNKDIKIVHDANGVWDLQLVTGKTLDAEGTYTVKIVLDNGRAVTTSFEVKKFQTPVAIVFHKTPSTVELGKAFTPTLLFADANGVTEVAAASKVTLAATGYAIATVAGNTITVDSDEKYAGSVIKLTAVSDKYDLVATKEVTVAAEAVAIAFDNASLKANVNNKVEWDVVDANGNAVSLTKTTVDIKYVVLEKPADAKVSVVDRTDNANFAGAGEMAITCNKVGNVKVQVIAKVNINAGAQYKYYTGVQEFAFGTGEVGKSVVMSIGSNEMIADGKVATVDAKPMIQDNRTFVPFRALAEAFGATVAYDQATSAVTAELNGVKVVMTIGSPVYTVNGIEKTADVVPFIADSRTYVPVRFAAEAFGITVTPTYNADGSVADVLFNM